MRESAFHSPAIHSYDTREDLAEALATGVAAVLAGSLATRGSAVLAVSGGTTPQRFFRKLAQTRIDWSGITVVLVDERWVPPDHPRSNARLVADNLLRDEAAAARLEPFYRPHLTANEAQEELSRQIAAVPKPFDAVILGMGSDGHTASFFPGGDRLAEAIDPAGQTAVVAMEAPDAGEPRVTLTMPLLIDARFLALHIEGEEKRRVLEDAMNEGPVERMPVRAVLRHEREEPLQIFWAP